MSPGNSLRTLKCYILVVYPIVVKTVKLPTSASATLVEGNVRKRCEEEYKITT